MTERDLARQAYRRLRLKADFELEEPSAFVEEGQHNLKLLKDCGLLPHHKVLDHGCGVFKTGWWLLRYLYDYNYFAAGVGGEPLETCKDTVLEGMTDRMGGVRERVECSFAMFNLEFDFVFSDKTWSALGQDRVELCLDNFLQYSLPGATYLSSVRLTDGEGTLGDEINLVNARHSERWLRAAVALRGLKYEKLDIERDDELSWVALSRIL